MEDKIEKLTQKSAKDETKVEEAEKIFEELLQSEDEKALIENGISFHRRGENDKAAKFFRRAAELGSITAMNRIGILCADAISVEERLSWYKKAVELGDTFAMVNIGDMYYFGDGVKMDKKIAFKFYLQAAEQDEVDMPEQVGLMYYLGIGTEVDYEKALYWTKNALQYSNNPVASYTLAEMYFHGCGVEQNYEEALKFYDIAAKGEDRAAMYKLGEIYEFGYGVEVSKSRAYENYRKAATSGHVIAMSKVALDYENQRELDKAVDWYTLAANFGNEFAKNRLKVLSKVANCKRNVKKLKKNYLQDLIRFSYPVYLLHRRYGYMDLKTFMQLCAEW